ncbi:NB-ARC domain, LRR domain containing protein [Parasponia andersonii]|uniref:NB-ARC domain, LRR domain containing protein n=1 Tax=Parasponia andersonii TaxID=3476 RepID=A0A2P5A472_PARAD|nr:NB-ARC domain, LRR domain containing protein [Parasponia andersonii]
MADSVVASVIEKLLQLQEKELFKGVNQDIRVLIDGLGNIQCFLKDAEARSEKEHTNVPVKNWLKQVTEEANRIEDAIDEYLRHVAPRSHQSRTFFSFLSKINQLVKQVKARQGMASKIQNSKMSIREIEERSQRHGFQRDYSEEGSSTGKTSHEGPRLGLPSFEEDEVVGIDSVKETLITTLVEGAPTRTVISIVGMSGCGKTTLAKTVYENDAVKGHFDRRAWITVPSSYNYNTEKLLENLTKQIYNDAEYTRAETDTIQDSIDSLRQYLETKRYAVVLDEVCDRNFWKDIEGALPKNDKGSRIIITTRMCDVIAVSRETSCDVVQQLEPLSMEMSWTLFCKKAFRTENGGVCPRELEELCLRVVQKCEGLPVVLVAIASLLSRKERTVLEWQRVLDSLNLALESNPDFKSSRKILFLGYSDLPPHLKSCFLSFSIFPEDYSIAESRLYQIWIAEGFVKPERDKTLEEIAKEYLEELINRNLVQVSDLELHGYDRMCKVYDFMREIILLKAYEIGFCGSLNENNSKFEINWLRKFRRLSVSRGANNAESIVENSRVRSIFAFGVAEMKKSFLVNLFENCKLLTLLEFENVPLEDLPVELGNLFHLKYLGLKNTKVKKLPKSVRKLQNLQTLDLRNTLLIELPIEINKLQNLRHLLAGGNSNKFCSDSTQCVRVKEGFWYLENLQTLVTLDAHLSGIDLIRKLDKLKQLRRLGILRLTAEVASALFACITQMSLLESLTLHSLTLHSENKNEMLDLQTISSPPPFLQRLVVKGRLQKLPDWFSSLQYLSMLYLSFSGLRMDPLGYLCHLPNLVYLWLYQAYDGEQLHFEEGCLPKLKLLVLRELHGLKMVEIDKGALPHLEELRIGSRMPLIEVPSGVRHLQNLKVLANYDMTSEFVLSMQPDGGSNYWKIEHVPSVHFLYKGKGRRYKSYKLGEPGLLDFLQGLASNKDEVAQREVRLSFYCSDDEEHSTETWNGVNRLSISSESRVSFFSDDIED